MLVVSQKNDQTRMLRMLGRHYKWWFIFLHALKANSAYFIADIFWFLSKFVSIFSIVYVWFITGNQTTGNIVILNNFFLSIASFQCVYFLNYLIHKGELTSYLLSPTPLKPRMLIWALGIAVRTILFTMLVFLCLFVYLNSGLDYFKLTVILIVFLPITILLQFLLDFCVGCLSFWVKEGFGNIAFYQSLSLLLTGSLIPLSFFNQAILEVSPFSFLAYQQVKIYQGDYLPVQIILIYVLGLLWVLILLGLSRILLMQGLKKYEATGL